MIPRMDLYEAWWDYYANRPENRREKLERTAGVLEGKMRMLATFPGKWFHWFSKKELIIAYGMALGVHKQLLASLDRPWGRLTSSPKGAKLRVEGGHRTEKKDQLDLDQLGFQYKFF